MGTVRRNGVDLAVDLLSVLAEGGGGGATELARRIGAPRSTFYRIAGILCDEGLIARSGGQFVPGQACMAILARNIAGPLARSRMHDLNSLGIHQGALWREPVDPEEPLRLTCPRLGRRPPFRLGFSNAAMDNPWRTALVHGVEHAASQASGNVGWLAVRHAGNSALRQAEDIRALASQGVDSLLVSAVAGEEAYEAIDRASGDGVVVVVVDRGVPSWVRRASFVTTNDEFIGRITALWLAEILDGEGRILLLPGLAGTGPAIQRLAAAKAVFAQFPGLSEVNTAWTDWSDQKAHAIVTDLLVQDAAGIDGVWCDSGLQSVGSMRAFVDAGFGPGTIPPHTGGDLNLAYKLALRNKIRLAAVDYPPAMGVAALRLALDALQGKWIPTEVSIPSDVIVTHGADTPSVKASRTVEDHVQWSLPDDLILSAGLGPAYNPKAFRVHYPGNLYNRSAAGPMR